MDEQREEQSKRGLLLDQQLLDPAKVVGETESEFRRRFEEKRTDLMAELAFAEHDTDRLEKECNEAGVEIELGPSSDVDTQSVHELEPAAQEQPKVTYLVPARQHRLVPADAAATSTLLTARLPSGSVERRLLPTSPTQNRRHIRQWIDEVAAVPESIIAEGELGFEQNDETIAALGLESIAQEVVDIDADVEVARQAETTIIAPGGSSGEAADPKAPAPGTNSRKEVQPQDSGNVVGLVENNLGRRLL